MIDGSPKPLANPNNSPRAILDVRVTSRAACPSLQIDPDGVLQARVSAAPVDGAANKALLKLVAESLRIAPSHISIVSGPHSRHKRILVEGLDPSEVRQRLLEAALQPRH